jgi:hypothetical protein
MRPHQPDPDRPIDVNRFLMLVPLNGYCWLDEAYPSPAWGEENRRRLASPPPYMVVNGLGAPARRYRPLVETPDLFRIFRDLELGRDSLLNFANQYGWIGERGMVDYQGGTPEAVGMQTWEHEVQSMIVADRLLAWVNEKDQLSLKEYFSWHPTRFDVRVGIQMDGRKMRSVIRAGFNPALGGWAGWMGGGIVPYLPDELPKIGWKRGDLTVPALDLVIHIVNTRLKELCRPLLYRNHRGTLAGYWTPANLLGCIWLQFYLMVIGQLKLRRCTLCGKEMDVSQSKSTRKMHDSCSKRMRMRRWRASKRRSATE